MKDIPERLPKNIPILNVQDYGAIPDDDNLDTTSINKAIEVASTIGRGIIYFPPGTYLSGSIHMKSNITLKLANDTILRGTRDMSKYDPRESNPWSDYQDSSQSYIQRSLIWGENLHNVGIIGTGLIDGNDAFEPWPIINKTFPPPFGWIFSTIFYQIDDEIFHRGAKRLPLNYVTIFS